MPTTHRHAVHDGKKGLSYCINYCKDPTKTESEKYVTAINCSKTFAVEEFLMIHEKFNSDISNQERICYHAWQSFDYRDNITPDQAHEIGVKLCKELYPDFQCIVCTHLDKGHLHNHIIINSRNMSGRKLEDRLGNTIEGLYGLRETSDRIAKEYGCSVIEDAPKIGRYKSKKYRFQRSTTAWKHLIIEQIDKLKETCNSFDEMLEHLAIEGYVIKKGKHIGVLPPGKERNVRLYSLGKEYCEQALRDFFQEKRSRSFSYQFQDPFSANQGEVIQQCMEAATQAKTAILKSEAGLDEQHDYPKYYNTRYLEMKRYHELIKSIEYLNEENIYTYEDLMEKSVQLHAEMELLELQYKKEKSRNHTLQAKAEYAEIYIKYYNRYCMYQEQLDAFQHADLTEEVEAFLYAKDQLNGATINEVRELMVSCNKQKQTMNQQFAYLSYLGLKVSEVDRLRMDSLDTDPRYIKGMSFSNDMINKQKTSESEYCVRLPYTQQFVFLQKDCVLWNNYGKRATMYLIDDKEYDVFDRDGNLLHTVTGEQLEELSLKQKEEIIKSKQNMSVTDIL